MILGVPAKFCHDLRYSSLDSLRLFTATYPLTNFTSRSVVRTTPLSLSDLFFNALLSTDASKVPPLLRPLRPLHLPP
jgi:hypothetical protein